MSRLRGMYPALITPFTADGTVDEAALRHVVAYHIEKGTDGLFVCGSLGTTALNLSQLFTIGLVSMAAAARSRCPASLGELISARCRGRCVLSLVVSNTMTVRVLRTPLIACTCSRNSLPKAAVSATRSLTRRQSSSAT